MTPTVLSSVPAPSHDPLKLAALEEAWSFELPDIDDRLAGDDPDSVETWMKDLGRKLQAKTGADTSSQLAALSLIPGGTALAVAVSAIGSGADLFAGKALHEGADRTQRLLALRENPIELLDWDSIEELVVHTNEWLPPRLQARVATLTEALEASEGHDLIKTRLKLYQTAVIEVTQVLQDLRLRGDTLKASWNSRRSDFDQASAVAKLTYVEAKKALHLSVSALLMNRDEAEEKLNEIEAAYLRLKCSHSSMFSECDELHLENSKFCPVHTCFEPGCVAKVKGKKRNCEAHSNKLGHVYAELPKTFALIGFRPSEDGRGVVSIKKKSGCGWKVLGGLVIFIVAISYLGANS